MLLKFLNYLLFKIKALPVRRNGSQHHLVSDLKREIFVNRNDSPLKQIILWRKEILKDETRICSGSFGAGTRYRGKGNIKAGRMAALSGLPHKHGVLLYNMVRKFNPSTVIELGTGLGLSTAYLASARPETTVISLEGVYEKTQYAQILINRLTLDNIKFLSGSFDELLPGVLSESSHPILFFIDGDHTFNSTLRYFKLISLHAEERTIIIFDDIHWSKEMKKVWNIIKENRKVTLSIDLFRCGIVFFHRSSLKQHFYMNF